MLVDDVVSAKVNGVKYHHLLLAWIAVQDDKHKNKDRRALCKDKLQWLWRFSSFSSVYKVSDFCL